jgi:hypothetical protein
VYPNPTFNSLTIKLADDTIKSLAIYNILGQTMKECETANKNVKCCKFSCGTIYFKITTTNGDVLSKRFCFKQLY